ncbi:hypothetical protein B0H63DRAFT_462895 [Podospora didyma]|uniref:Uncharacterized protein n=1 Tax=Podospora didyma TaxID=330526 RepID=A0AAE0U902_9PEZI|nr:hypothetical protein B0H63DRAFT_462895 [Podospora didyma]
MPTTEPPKKQAPMEAAADSTLRPGAPATIITKQPVSSKSCNQLFRQLTRIFQRAEPLPSPENELSLRGGRMTLGFNCCDGHCSFHKGCC